ncbi:unnamed protein product [Paramecium pentaurelia]|uniref:Trichocyst matrix protein n=1 Tax=Paramecium pentaurelia TaxID=43138 RepID=A0A8S1WUW4_9CILI|nr:unnamed protein product [Paramecium pentaurelia]
MKVIIFIALLACILGQQPEMLEQIAQNSFGRQILQTIQLELTQENAARQIYTMLNKLFYDLRDEDARSSKANGERQAQCSDQFTQINTIQEKAVVAKADYERQIPGKQEELANKLAQVEQKNAEIQRNDQLQINFSEQRRKEHEAYEHKRDELIGLINGLKQAQQIIRQLQTTHPGGALVQLKEHHEQLLKSYAANSEFKNMASLLMELCTDIKIHSDNDNVQVIVDIINDLIESIYDVQKREMYAEDWAQKFFEQDLLRLSKENVRLQGQIADDQVAAEFAQQRLEDLQQQALLQQIIYDNKEVERKSFEVACKEDNNAAEQARVSRNEQIQIVLQLLELFENNFNDRTRAALLQIVV